MLHYSEMQGKGEMSNVTLQSDFMVKSKGTGNVERMVCMAVLQGIDVILLTDRWQDIGNFLIQIDHVLRGQQCQMFNVT